MANAVECTGDVIDAMVNQPAQPVPDARKRRCPQMFADDQRQGEPLFPCVAAMDNNNRHHHAKNKRRLLFFTTKTKVYNTEQNKDNPTAHPKP